MIKNLVSAAPIESGDLAARRFPPEERIAEHGPRDHGPPSTASAIPPVTQEPASDGQPPECLLHLRSGEQQEVSQAVVAEINPRASGEEAGQEVADVQRGRDFSLHILILRRRPLNSGNFLISSTDGGGGQGDGDPLGAARQLR